MSKELAASAEIARIEKLESYNHPYQKFKNMRRNKVKKSQNLRHTYKIHES